MLLPPLCKKSNKDSISLVIDSQVEEEDLE